MFCDFSENVLTPLLSTLRCSIKFEKELYMNYREINYESRDKMKTIKDKQNLIVDAADLVRSVWRPFKTEALAEKVKVIKLQG